MCGLRLFGRQKSVYAPREVLKLSLDLFNLPKPHADIQHCLRCRSGNLSITRINKFNQPLGSLSNSMSMLRNHSFNEIPYIRRLR